MRPLASRATCTVSRTVRSGNRRAAWNVLPRPNRARLAGLMGEASLPRIRMVPSDGAKPPMAFMSVDLPAPLVPMRPTTSPGWATMEASLTARRPPKVTDTSVTSRAGLVRDGGSAWCLRATSGVVVIRFVDASPRRASASRSTESRAA